MDPGTGHQNFDPSKYDISYEYGFLLENPMTELASDYFQPWNTLSLSLPDLIRDRTVRKTVHQLPLLDHRKLSSYKELRFSHMVLTWAAAGYVWQDGEQGVTKVLPRQLAIPLCGVSEELGVQPVISHVSFLLSNWKIKDYTRPLELSNVEAILKVHPKEACNWFIIVTWLVEFKFAPAIKIIEHIYLVMQMGNDEKLITYLKSLQEIIHNMQDAMTKMHEHLTAEEFYTSVRPYLSGWQGQGSPLPDGLIYEGVQDKPIKLSGGSAAQSSSVQALDAVLGIGHTGEHGEFLNDMRKYMPRGHRNYLEELWQRPSLKAYVEKSSDQAVKEVYNEAVTAVKNFRSYHIQIVTKYIITQAKRQEQDNKNEGTQTPQGTGGTDIIPFLKNLRDETDKSTL